MQQICIHTVFNIYKVSVLYIPNAKNKMAVTNNEFKLFIFFYYPLFSDCKNIFVFYNICGNIYKIQYLVYPKFRYFIWLPIRKVFMFVANNDINHYFQILIKCISRLYQRCMYESIKSLQMSEVTLSYLSKCQKLNTTMTFLFHLYYQIFKNVLKI